MNKLAILAIVLFGSPLLVGAQQPVEVSSQPQTAPSGGAAQQPSGGTNYKGFAGPDIYLTAADNWKIAASYLPPADNHPVALLVHSIARSKSDWKPLTDELTRQGFGYFALDLRGHGASCTDPSGASTTWRNFRRAGTDNEFNQMTRDLEAATAFLAANGIEESRIIMIGAGLGSNLSVKFAAIHPEIMMAALLSPTLNASRDVLAVNPMRVYGNRPLLLLASVNDPRVLKEAQILHSIAKMGAGNDNIIFITVAKGPSWRLLTKPVTAALIQWIKTPAMPSETAPANPDEAEDETSQTDEQEQANPGELRMPEGAPEEIQ